MIKNHKVQMKHQLNDSSQDNKKNYLETEIRNAR
jgi:hypothetical protein